MSVTLELEPELEAAARAAAQARGVPVETYLHTLVRGSLPLPNQQPQDYAKRTGSPELPEAGVLSDAEWDRLLRASTFRSKRPLSDEALSREAIYED